MPAAQAYRSQPSAVLVATTTPPSHRVLLHSNYDPEARCTAKAHSRETASTQRRARRGVGVRRFVTPKRYGD